MKKITPDHWYALLLLVVCLSVITGCGRTPVNQLDLTTLLPGEPAWLVSAEVRTLRGFELWPEKDGIGDLFFEAAGIDADKDLDRVLLGIYPSGDETGEFTALLTGRFHRETLLANLEKDGLVPDSWRDYTVMNTASTHHTEPTNTDLLDYFVVYFDDTAIGIADTREGATGMIDRLVDGSESLDRHPGFGPLLATVDRTAPFWCTGLLAEDAISGLTSDLPVQGMIPALDNLAFSARMETGLQLTGHTLLPTAEEATQLAGQLNGWVKLGAVLIQTNPQGFRKDTDSGDETMKLVAETLDQVVVTSVESEVRLEANISDELVGLAVQSVSEQDAESPDTFQPLPTP